MRFIFFTKTNWNEPPRLRHQIARLLEAPGNDVVFFQKPMYPWQSLQNTYFDNGRILLYRYKQLIHHRLRIGKLLNWLNTFYEKKQIMGYLLNLNICSDDVIINFNYDYYFLREILPNNKIITIINDDFWSHPYINWFDPFKWVLRKTLLASNRVITVSKPLVRQLSKIRSVDLLYPWSDIEYMQPKQCDNRKIILFWGFINHKIDFNFVAKLVRALYASSSDWKLIFAGPVEITQNNLLKHEMITYLPQTDLNNLDFSSVFVGIIPYKTGIESIDVISFPNKLLQLLSRGIPIAITGMPDFIDEPFVFRLDSEINIAIETLNTVKLSFDELQPDIKNFVTNNSSETRLQQFMDYL
jgi:hypothetical protein